MFIEINLKCYHRRTCKIILEITRNVWPGERAKKCNIKFYTTSVALFVSQCLSFCKRSLFTKEVMQYNEYKTNNGKTKENWINCKVYIGNVCRNIPSWTYTHVISQVQRIWYVVYTPNSIIKSNLEMFHRISLRSDYLQPSANSPIIIKMVNRRLTGLKSIRQLLYNTKC